MSRVGFLVTLTPTRLLTDLEKPAEYPPTQEKNQDVIEGAKAWNECHHSNQLVRLMC